MTIKTDSEDKNQIDISHQHYFFKITGEQFFFLFWLCLIMYFFWFGICFASFLLELINM